MATTEFNKKTTRRRLMGGGVAFLGALGLYAMSTMLRHAFEQSGWQSTRCRLEKVEMKSDGYGIDWLEVDYTYDAEGRPYRSNQYELKSNVSRSETYFKRELERLKKAPDAECYFDPANPSEAVLKKTTWGDAASAIIPAIFLLIGVAIVFSSFDRGVIDRSLENDADGEGDDE